MPHLTHFRLISGLLAALSLTTLSGCLYRFSGGGLPSDIRTVAVLPFENRTPEPTLTQDVNAAVRAAVEERLGLRQAGEETADAIVRGTITRYEPDVPVAYTGNNANNQVNVTRRLVQITVSVEIINQRTDRTLWQRAGLTVEGDYEPGTDTEQEGREEALQRLTVNIVEGAQSQW